MKIKLYIAYGIIICSLFLAAGARGLVLSSIMQQPGHQGAQGHGMAHK